MKTDVRIGTAGWSIPKQHAAAFPSSGNHLERYASVFDAVEINSSFYRPHRPTTYARWAGCVPDKFRFAVKVPKAVTHDGRLRDVAEPLARFLSEVGALGPKLGPLLVQLPPSLPFEPGISDEFLRRLRGSNPGAIVCEPRHRSWFVVEVEGLLDQLWIARVAADPAPVPEGREPGGWRGLIYRRLHGSPRIYYSAYGAAALPSIAAHLRSEAEAGVPCWCIFDNTAAFAATRDALDASNLARANP